MIKIHSIATADDLHCSSAIRPTASGNVTILDKLLSMTLRPRDFSTLIFKKFIGETRYSLLQITSDVFSKSILLALDCVRNTCTALAKRTILRVKLLKFNELYNVYIHIPS